MFKLPLIALTFSLLTLPSSFATIETKSISWKKMGAGVTFDLPQISDQEIHNKVFKRIKQSAHSFFSSDACLPFLESPDDFATCNDAIYAQHLLDRDIKPTDVIAVFSHRIETEVLFEGSNLVSLLLTFNQYSGGAHSNTNGLYVNYNPTTGEFIDSLNFLDDAAQDRILQEIQTQLEDKLGEHLWVRGKDLKGLLPGHFGFIDEHTLQFTFWPYEVSCYGAGTQTVVLKIK